MSARPAPRPRIGLALGSGAARGLAHIGVLKVLEQEQIPVDVIAGTSIGAFIGALYAAGVPVAQMEEVARDVDWRQLARLLDPIIPTSGILDGKRVAQFMAELLPIGDFGDLRIPLAVTATDVETGELIILRQGNLLEALRAAVAFPGIFTPVRYADRFLVDGGLCNPVPVDVARTLGAERLIGVCAIPEVEKRQTEAAFPAPPPTADRGLLDKLFTARQFEQLFRDIWRSEPDKTGDKPPASRSRKPPNIFRICAQSVAIMENEINALRLADNHIDVLIRPDLNGITLLEFHRAEELIRAGEATARAQLPQLRQLCRQDCTARPL